MNHVYVDTAEECLAECKSQPGCEWFSFSNTVGICALYRTCDTLDQGCPDCVSGENECEGGGSSGGLGVTIYLEIS